ncbi:glucose-methanol-choline oxidoreductase [Tupanvirus soda lake]|uniref:Glucose-methanol-choline oxidoreductase n=2 Tax=Tupanvirus TaxID=2094720 RepID=A0A6N1NX64_9VIRU|nr:glucose-methanol-choline oxidoreductase [Tupanvirus soda lake]QKU35753.1 glucose-methanol-choline oxidoreductase [Tupanvirus soda lake]
MIQARIIILIATLIGTVLSCPSYDFAVVGVGTAGSLVATRLVQAGYSVIALETGRDLHNYTNTVFPPPDYNAYSRLTRIEYSRYVSEVDAHTHYMHLPEEGEGGAQELNQGVWLWPYAGDLDQWASNGATGWDSSSMKYWQKAVENCPLCTDPDAGKSGPIHIDYFKQNASQPLINEITNVFGVPFDDSLETDEGVFIGGQSGYRYNNGIVARSSTWRELFQHELGNPLLRYESSSFVDKIIFVGSMNKAHKVLYIQNGISKCARIQEKVVLTAGVFQNAAILQRSGVGDSQFLQNIGINVVAHLPGVGKIENDGQAGTFVFAGITPELANLQWQPIAAIWSTGLNGPDVLDAESAFLLFPSGAIIPGVPAAVSIPYVIGNIYNGSVSITSKDPFSRLDIDIGLNLNDIFLENVAQQVRKIRSTYANLGTFAEVVPGYKILPLNFTNDELLAYLKAPDANVVGSRARVNTHVSGSVRIGSLNDPYSCADANGNIYGVKNVVLGGDMSIHPLLRIHPSEFVCASAEKQAAYLISSVSK